MPRFYIHNAADDFYFLKSNIRWAPRVLRLAGAIVAALEQCSGAGLPSPGADCKPQHFNMLHLRIEDDWIYFAEKKAPHVLRNTGELGKGAGFNLVWRMPSIYFKNA